MPKNTRLRFAMLHTLAHLIHEGAKYEWQQLMAGDTDRVEPGKLLIEVTVDHPEFWRTCARIVQTWGQGQLP